MAFPMPDDPYHKPTYHAAPHDLGRVKIQVRALWLTFYIRSISISSLDKAPISNNATRYKDLSNLIIEIPHSQHKKPMNLGLFLKSKSYHGPEVFHPSPVYHTSSYHEPPVHHAKPHDLGRVKIQVRSSRLYFILFIYGFLIMALNVELKRHEPFNFLWF